MGEYNVPFLVSLSVGSQMHVQVPGAYHTLLGVAQSPTLNGTEAAGEHTFFKMSNYHVHPEEVDDALLCVTDKTGAVEGMLRRVTRAGTCSRCAPRAKDDMSLS